MIFDEIRACQLCHDNLPLGSHPVIQGHTQSRIIIAGQAPSQRVHLSGKPFSDASGTRLREWLGVTELEFYNPDLFAIIPMAFCYPGKGSSGDLAPPKLCARTWRARLMESFDTPKLTIVIGQYAQAYHFEDFTSVTEQTLKWKTLLPHYLALPHPSPRNRFWLQKNTWFEEKLIPDLKKCVKTIINSV